MIESPGNAHYEQPFNVFIGDEEWAKYSFQNKVRLLYRLKQSNAPIAKALLNTVSLLVEEEQDKREIDYDATLKNAIRSDYMAGIKNPYQMYGATPFDSIQGKSIEERHIQMQVRQMTPYCRLCGGEIVNALMDEHGHSVNPEWERAYQVHYRCYMKRAGQ